MKTAAEIVSYIQGKIEDFDNNPDGLSYGKYTKEYLANEADALEHLLHFIKDEPCTN